MQELCLAQDDGRAYPAAALKSMSGEGAQDRAVQLRRANSRPHNSRFASVGLRPYVGESKRVASPTRRWPCSSNFNTITINFFAN
jgi:hypothetical protein